MRNLDIADSRSRLEQYASLGLVGGHIGELVGVEDKRPAIAPGEAGK